VVFSIFTTVVDVIGRTFGRPILGTYELVSFSSCIIYAFSLPLTSQSRAHVSVDLIMPMLSKFSRKIFTLVHKLVGTGLFFMMGCSLIYLGTNLRRSGEASALIELPIHAAAYIAGACFFVVCVVLLSDIAKILGGTYE
jgi:TRAP-type C4-dicarboxylate transport system permease small subunit